MLLWMSPNNALITVSGHQPRFNEPAVVYEPHLCFNCGGGGLIEIGTADFGFKTLVCPVCAGVGEVGVGYPSITFPEWVALEIPNALIIGISLGEINLTLSGVRFGR